LTKQAYAVLFAHQLIEQALEGMPEHSPDWPPQNCLDGVCKKCPAEFWLAEALDAMDRALETMGED
jgi:hypothetical protein